MVLRTGLLASAAICAGLSLAGAAWAADDDIIVTGQGLEQKADNGALGDKSILDTPFSITVIDAKEIEKRQPQSIAQLFANDPSIYSSASAGTVNWWGTQIRGLGVRNYYVDDIPLLLHWGGDYPLEPVESVQALKGATGFMYGFGAPGGAISYKTKRPTGERMLSTEVGYRNSSLFFGNVDTGGPIDADGKLGFRVNLATERGDAYNKANVNRSLGSLAVDYEITPALTWRSTVTYEKSNLKREPFNIYWGYSGGDLPEVPNDFDDAHIDNSFYRTVTLVASTSLDWQITDNWSASAKYGYTRKRHRSNKDFITILNEAGDYEGYLYQFGDREVVHFGQGMVQGQFETGPIRHELVGGASMQASLSDFGNSIYDLYFTGNVFQPQPFLNPQPISFAANQFPYDERQTALFASDTLHFGEHWQAILGLRRTYYDQETIDNADPDLRIPGYNITATTPTLALIYKPIEQASIYASYVESMEGGGIVSDPIYANQGEVLGATISKQYEAGVKYDGERFKLTGAVFRVERANQMDVLRADGSRILTQDGVTQYDGVEASGQFQVNDDLTIGLGAVRLKPKIDEVAPIVLDPGPPEVTLDLTGNRPAEAYKWQFVANAEYNVAAIEGLSLHGNVRYFGNAPTDDFNGLYIPSYTMVSGGFNYRTEIAGRGVTLAGNINNLLNKQYWTMQGYGESINGVVSLRVDW